VTRLLHAHPEIRVDLGVDGTPTAIAWADRREPVEVCNRWRVEEAWWRGPIARDYFKVVGRRWLALVYLDRVTGTWHLERLYD
jgi:hypothetical protein